MTKRGPGGVPGDVISSGQDLSYPQTSVPADIVVSNLSGGGTFSENGGFDTFTVVLSAEPSADVTIGLRSSDINAATVSPDSLTFTDSDWNNPQTVTISGVDNYFDQPDRTVTIRFDPAVSADGDYSGMKPSSFQVTVTDDDTAGVTVSALSEGGSFSENGGEDTFTVVLDSEPGISVEVLLTPSDLTAVIMIPTQLYFHFYDWNRPYPVTIRGKDNQIDEVDRTISINVESFSLYDGIYNALPPSSFQVTVTDDDTAGITVSALSGGGTFSENGGTDTFTVVLDTQPTAEVTIGVVSSNTAAATVSPTTLSFTDGNWDDPQTVTISGVDNLVDEVDRSPTISFDPAVSGDTFYAGKTPSDISVTVTDDDTAGITVSALSGGGTFSENGGTDTFTVVLDTQPTAEVTIGVVSSNTAAATVSPTTLSFTDGNWDDPQTVTISGVDNLVDEVDRSPTIGFDPAVSGDSFYAGKTPSDISVTVTDDDTAGITVSAPGGGGTFSENGGSDTFTVVLDTKPTADVTIGVTSSNTAAATVSPATLSFTDGNWDTSQTVTISGVDNQVDEVDRSSTIGFDPAVSGDTFYAGKTPSDISVTVTDDDTAGITVSAPGGGGTFSENGGSDTFTVVLDTKPTSDVTIGVVSSNTAAATVSPATLSFTDGNWDDPQTVTISGVDNQVDEVDRSPTIGFDPAVSGDTFYAGKTPSDISVTVTDDDTAGITVSALSGGGTFSENSGSDTFTVVLDTEPTADVTIGLSSSDTTVATVSPNSLTFTDANWDTPQTVTISGVDNQIDEVNRSSTISFDPAVSGDTFYAGKTLSDISVTVTDDDTAGITMSALTGGGTFTENGGSDTFTIVLDTEPTADVTVGVTSSNTAAATVSPATLSFTAGNWNAPQTVTISGVDNQVDEVDRSSTIGFDPAVSGDTFYTGQTPSSFQVTVTDDDTAGITVSAFTGGGTLSENGGTDTITVVLDTEPTAEVTIGVFSSNTAVATVSPAALSFTAGNWNVPQAITISGVDNQIDEPDRTVSIGFDAAVSGDAFYSGKTLSDISVTVTDDDTAGITVSALSGGGTFSENGGSDTFTVVLDSQPTAEVTIGPTSSDSTVATTSPLILTFTDTNWNTPQTVTVSGVDNVVDESDRSSTIGFDPAVSGDDHYDGLTASSFQVTVTDDDTAGITVSGLSGGGTFSENGGSDTFTVVLDTKPTVDVSIGVTSSDTAAATISPLILTFTGANWNTPQTVTVSGVDNVVDELDRTPSIGFDPAVSGDDFYDGLTPSSFQVTVTDDDGAGITVSALSGGGTFSENGGSDTFTVVLDTEPTADVTVGVSSSDTTVATVSPNSLTFTDANWDTPQTVTTSGVDNRIDESDRTATIGFDPAVSDDTFYSGQKPSGFQVTVTDDDSAGITVSAPSGGGTFSEDDGSDTFTIVLDTEPTADVTVGVSSSDTTAATVSPSSLIFTDANWDVPQTVTISGVDNQIDETDRTATIDFDPAVSTDSRYSGKNLSNFQVTVTDNDSAGITVSALSGGGTFSENGGSDTFTIVLDTEPTADVTVGVFSSDTTAASIFPATLSFTGGNWDVPQAVTISGVDNQIDEPDRTVSIGFDAAVSGDAFYSGKTPSGISVTVADDDQAGATVGAVSGDISESGATARFTVVIDTEPTADVIIPIVSADTGEGTVLPASLVFTADDWNIPQTVTITGVDDDIDDGDQVFQVELRAGISTDTVYNGLDFTDVSVTNLDNDGRTLIVTNTNDGGPGSLRRVIAGSRSGDTITFSDALAGDIISLTSGQITIHHSLHLFGFTTDRLVISGNGAFRVFNILKGDVEIRNLTISDGRVSGNGGGILSAGILSLDKVTISGNSTSDGGNGGGVSFTGTLKVTNSTISGNLADGSGGGVDAQGRFSFNNVTIFNNTAAVSGNAVNTGGDGNIGNSIVAGGCSGYTNTSAGYNMETDTTCGLNAGTDMQNTDPLLDALSANGGPTYTHALQDASPAIDAGNNASSENVDQRGINRPVDGDRDGTATSDIGAFELTPLYFLSVSTIGQGDGTITSSPEGIHCGNDCAEEYDHGTLVTLSAAPDAGSFFTGWSGGGCSGTGTCTVTMDNPVAVSASFDIEPPETYTLNLLKDGNGSGTVTSSPAGISCGDDCTHDFDEDTYVTLTAQPEQDSVFAGWSGGGCLGTGVCTLTMNMSRIVTARFITTPDEDFMLTVTTQGTGQGIVESDPAGITCGSGWTDCSADYDQGSLVALTATPDLGSIFSGWSGSGCIGTGECVVSMDSARSVTANFETLVLKVIKSGTGDGLVTSQPPGIDCGAVCESSFSLNSVVLLTAEADDDSVFTGWSGGNCAGSGTCSVITDRSLSVNPVFDRYDETADLAVSKSADVLSTQAGEMVTYQLTVTNFGPDEAEDIRVTDVLPDEVTYWSDSSSGTYDPETGLWNVGRLAVEESVSMQILVLVEQSGPITNTADITHSSLADGNSHNNTCTVTLNNPEPCAGLTVTKTTDRNPVPVGEDIVYSINVANNGPARALDVELTDLMPLEISSPEYFINGMQDFTAWPDHSTLDLGDMEADGRQTVYVRGSVDAMPDNGKLVNTAEATSETTDPDASDDVSTVRTTVSEQPRVAGLALNIEVDDQAPLVGDEVAYTITLTNNGPDSADEIKVRALLTRGLEYTGDDAGGSYRSRSGLWSAGTLAAEETKTINIRTVVARSGSIINRAAIIHSDAGDDNLSDNSASVEIEGLSGPIDLALFFLPEEDDDVQQDLIQYDVGDTKSYRLILTNNGCQNAAGVQVGISVPDGWMITDAAASHGCFDQDTLTWYVDNSDACGQSSAQDTGDLYFLNIEVTVTDPNLLQQSVLSAEIIASAEIDPDPTNNQAVQVLNQVNPFVVDIVLDAYSDRKVVQPSEIVTYTLVMRNIGPDRANGLTVSAVLPTSLALVSANADAGRYRQETGLWTVGSLGVYDFAKLEIWATPVMSDPEAVIGATLESVEENELDATDNSKDVTIDVKADSSSYSGGGGGGGCTALGSVTGKGTKGTGGDPTVIFVVFLAIVIAVVRKAIKRN